MIPRNQFFRASQGCGGPQAGLAKALIYSAARVSCVVPLAGEGSAAGSKPVNCGTLLPA